MGSIEISEFLQYITYGINNFEVARGILILGKCIG